MSYFRDQLENWLKTIEVVAPSVLDIGGSALPVKDRVSSWLVDDYHILDNNAEDVFHKDWELPHFPCDIEDQDQIKRMFRGKQYEVVFCLEVMEYVLNPLQTLLNIYSLLGEGGLLYITFPFVYPVHQPIKLDTFRYTPQGANKLLETAGFKRVDITKRVDRSGMLYQFYRADGMHPAKGIDPGITGSMFICTK